MVVDPPTEAVDYVDVLRDDLEVAVVELAFGPSRLKRADCVVASVDDGTAVLIFTPGEHSPSGDSGDPDPRVELTFTGVPGDSAIVEVDRYTATVVFFDRHQRRSLWVAPAASPGGSGEAAPPGHPADVSV